MFTTAPKPCERCSLMPEEHPTIYRPRIGVDSVAWSMYAPPNTGPATGDDALHAVGLLRCPEWVEPTPPLLLAWYRLLNRVMVRLGR